MNPTTYHLIFHNKHGRFELSNRDRLTLIAGPCAMESKDHAIFMAEELSKICENVGVNFIFKTSFDKANRTSIDSPRGIGLKAAIPVFRHIRNKLKIPVLTDVHEIGQAKKLKNVVDVVQIPAFLSRQTDLIIDAASAGPMVNIKKAQFMSAHDLLHVVKKVESTGNPEIILTERGTCFGYNTLVNDMRALVTMAETGYPVVFDATHSVQQPSGADGKSGGQSEFVFPLARAAVAIGVAGVFMEVHDEPWKALSDGPNMLRLDQVERIMKKLKEIDEVMK